MTGCTALKSWQVPVHKVHILTILQRTTPNTESCFDLLEKTMQEEFLPELLGEEIDDGEYRLELAHLPMNYSVLALPNTVNSASPNHQASKNVSAISSVH